LDHWRHPFPDIALNLSVAKPVEDCHILTAFNIHLPCPSLQLRNFFGILPGKIKEMIAHPTPAEIR
jgi:hypothetical protein